jgi:hypothetical protein
MTKEQLQELKDSGYHLAGCARYFVTSFPYMAPEILPERVAIVQDAVDRFDKAYLEANK